jgi:hypothetical protein
MYRCLKRVKGSHYTPYHTNGVINIQNRNVKKAIESYSRSIELGNPNFMTMYNLGCCYMLNGEMSKGWPLYELRYKLFPSIINFISHLTKPMWAGDDLTGKKLLVFCEQGVGDVIQHLRFAKELKNKNPSKIYLEVQDSLGKICEETGFFDGVFCRTNEKYPDLPDHDLICGMSSLPLLLGYKNLNVPNDPYIKPLKKSTLPFNKSFWNKYKDKFKIAISYCGSSLHNSDKLRSVPLIMFKHFEHPNVELFVLNHDQPKRMIDGVEVDLKQGDLKYTDLSDKIRDFNDTSHVLKHIDLVVTVDSALAHIAGACGNKTWVFIPHICDARWLLDKESTPWYPSMKLIRQKSKNWNEDFLNAAQAMRKEFNLDRR